MTKKPVDIWSGSFDKLQNADLTSMHVHVYMIYERMPSGCLRLYVGETANGIKRIHQSLKRFQIGPSTRIVLLLFSNELKQKRLRTYIEGRLYFALRRHPEIFTINNHRMVSVLQRGLDAHFQAVAENAISKGIKSIVDVGLKTPVPLIRADTPNGQSFEMTIKHHNQILYADAYINNGHWIVRKDSIAKHLKEGPSDDARCVREQLIEDGLLQSVAPELYRFSNDIAFSHANVSASVINGKSACGKSRWLVRGHGMPLRDTGLKLRSKKGIGSSYKVWPQKVDST